MNEITPLPCPCCGSTDLTEPFDVNFEYVVCQDCGLRAELDSWNRIPRLTARVEWLEHKSCSVCSGEPLPSGKPCICGGAGDSASEAQGLREALVCADARVEALEGALRMVLEVGLADEHGAALVESKIHSALKEPK